MSLKSIVDTLDVSIDMNQLSMLVLSLNLQFDVKWTGLEHSEVYQGIINFDLFELLVGKNFKDCEKCSNIQEHIFRYEPSANLNLAILKTNFESVSFEGRVRVVKCRESECKRLFLAVLPGGQTSIHPKFGQDRDGSSWCLMIRLARYKDGCNNSTRCKRLFRKCKE